VHDSPRISVKSAHHIDRNRASDVTPFFRRKEMTREQAQPNPQPNQRREQELDRRYGAIGISAVAAAVRCQNLGKTPAHARKQDDRSERAA
jgi:hypothetical protein